MRKEDEVEREVVQHFIENGCGCNLNCNKSFSLDKVLDMRASTLEMTTSERDLFIKGQIRTLIDPKDINEFPSSDDHRCRIDYKYHGKKICQHTFLIINGITLKYFKTLVEDYKLNGLAMRVHGNKGRLPSNALSFQDIERFKTFMENYVSNRGVSLPGRHPGCKDLNRVLLPTEDTKVKLWHFYADSCTESNLPFMKYKTFCTKWQELFPQYVIMQPRTDLCWTCQSNHNKIVCSANLSEAEKVQLIEEQTNHLKHATSEREFYKEKCENAKQVVKNLEKGWGPECWNASNSFSGEMHYSFDFAQQLHYPSNPLQPGPIYFKTARKAGLFGICCEGIPRQINYIIDESVATGKGANTVVSLLHSFFEKHGLGETTVVLHADNCSGQNKNGTVIRYLMWRILNKLHKKISIHFLIAGHTKFNCDACFGLIKKKTAKTYLSSLFDIAKCVVDSSPGSSMNFPDIVGMEDGTVLIPTYDWKNFLKPFFIDLKSIKSKHHFRMTNETIGIVYTKEYLESEETSENILKSEKKIPLGLPNIIKPDGLSLERKEYLYREIRPFCKEDSMDLVCPNVEDNAD